MLTLLIMKLVDWLQGVRPTPVSWIIPAIVLIASAYCCYRWYKVKRNLNTNDLGLLGERYMGDFLTNGLRGKDGYRVFHDIQFERMNIDHILVGPSGVFTIETKMARKAKGGSGKIEHVNGEVLIDGSSKWGNKAEWQAGHEAAWLHKLIGGQTPVQAVVVYPGWFANDDFKGDVWVLNEKFFVEKIKRLPPVLSEIKQNEISSTIESYARAFIERDDYKEETIR